MSERLEEEVGFARREVQRIVDAMGRSVIGQEQLRKRFVTALLCDGHLLLEGVPGLGKTSAVKAFASAVHASFKRIQFTPDLLPSDIIGTEIYRDGRFEVQKGPVFANIVLADEINRAPAKVQAALLETMQEHQVTIGKESFRVPEPFLVLATQNPIEQEGTYPLPEAQLDRFMMKLRVEYPTPEEERQMLDVVLGEGFNAKLPEPVMELSLVAELKSVVQKIYVDERIKRYIVDLVTATRTPEQFGLKLKPFIELGASPRSTLALYLAARVEALLSGESFVVPQNVKDVAADVLRHRILPSYEAEAQGIDTEQLIKKILDGVPVP